MVAGGFLITLEGIDGSGTTTQGERLGAALRRRGLEVHVTAEPSAGPAGQLIRRVLRRQEEMTAPALALLFAADRLDHLNREVEPALDRGAVVITDRYVLSSLAYQSVDLPLDWVAEINALARVPELTLFLRVSQATATARRRERGGAKERFDDPTEQERIAAAYEDTLDSPAVGEVEIIDAEASIDTVATEILAHVDARLDAVAEP